MKPDIDAKMERGYSFNTPEHENKMENL